MTWRDRIESGTTWLAGEVCFRTAGFALLGGAVPIFHLMRHHLAAEAQEFALGAALIVVLWAGLALAICGPALFKLQPLPVRAWLPASRRHRRRAEDRTRSTDAANKAQ